MYVGIITPDDQPAGCGNQVQARRLQQGLHAGGIATTVMSARQLAVTPPHFDLVHALHARKAGPHARRWARSAGVPFTVTCTGTDVEAEAQDPGTRDELVALLSEAAGVAVLHAGARALLDQWVPGLGRRATAIPQGPYLPPGRGRQRREWGIDDQAVVFLLVAGLRAVKRPAFALEPLAQLHAADPRVQWLVAGPALDPAVTADFTGQIRHRPWVRYLGEVPQADLVDLYRMADVVLNTSSAEGMPNALLEAMLLGRAVLAADVLGNRALIDHGVNGLLFGTAAEFAVAARHLAADPNLRRRLGEQAGHKVAHRHRYQDEIQAYGDLFRRALALSPEHPFQAFCPPPSGTLALNRPTEERRP